MKINLHLKLIFYMFLTMSVFLGLFFWTEASPLSPYFSDPLLHLLIFIGLGFLLASVFVYVSLRPLRILAQKARKIRVGEDIPFDDLMRHDELGSIYRSFATLINDLRKSNKDLTHMTKTLEHKVQTRTKELEDATQRAEEAAAVKSDFLSTMSHEIRTPLNGLLGFTRLLIEKPYEKTEEYLDIIYTSATSLLTIINDILDFSKLSANKMKIEALVFPLEDTLKKTLALFGEKVRKKGIQLKIEGFENLPQFVKGDPERFKQIILNLVSNAIKFTEKGEVVVSGRILERSGTSVMLEFSVADTGIGISTAVIDKLFDKFTQAYSSISRKYGGTGLGLAICRKLCNLMGGEIFAESQEGQGSRFWFQLPYEEMTAADMQHAEDFHDSLADAAAPLDISILVAEDNLVNQLLLMALLKKENYVCDVAKNGVEALEKAGQKDYDIILMDIQMPEMDGITATKLIRQLSEHYKYIPIIAVTAHVMQEEQDKILASGMTQVLNKPIDAKELYRLLKQLTAEPCQIL